MRGPVQGYRPSVVLLKKHAKSMLLGAGSGPLGPGSRSVQASSPFLGSPGGGFGGPPQHICFT